MRLPAITLAAALAATPVAAQSFLEQFTRDLENAADELDRALDGNAGATGAGEGGKVSGDGKGLGAGGGPSAGGTSNFQEANYRDWRFFAYRDGPAFAWNCFAQTDGGHEASLGFEHLAESEFGWPVVYYQHIEIEERHEPIMGAGERMGFWIDEGWLGGVVEEAPPVELADGEHLTHRAFPLNNERALAWMAEGDTVRVGREGEPPIYTGSLSGFTASYLKMVEVCGVEKRGVVN